jgi:type III secretion protein J
MALMLASCSKVELYGSLSEEDANEMLVLLNENNVKAQKKKETRQNEVFYSILVEPADVSRARSLLVKHNLPRRKQLGLTGVYKDKGLIPTPDEQKARFLLALKGEIINSLERIPDIVDADVVLNLPTVDEFADAETRKLKRPTASVVVKVKPSAVASQTVTEPKVQQFVANSVEGLNPRDVTVILSYMPTGDATVRPGEVVSLTPSTASEQVKAPSALAPATTQTLIGLNLDDASKGKLKIYLLIFFVVLLLLSAALILVIVRGSRMRRELQGLSEGGGQPAVEGQVLSEGPPQLGSSYTQAPEQRPESPDMQEEVAQEEYEEAPEEGEEEEPH